MNLSKIFNFIGLAGLLIFALLIYINKFAPEEHLLKAYKFKLIIAFVAIFLIHYIYLGVKAIQKKQWWWAGLLFIAPIPFYWLYFLWDSVKEYKAFTLKGGCNEQ